MEKIDMKKVERARLEAKALWVKACRHDEIPPNAKFVALSPGNPFDKPYNKAMEKYLGLRSKMGMAIY